MSDRLNASAAPDTSRRSLLRASMIAVLLASSWSATALAHPIPIYSAWVQDGSSETTVPYAEYSHHEAGLGIVSTRISTGYYRVRFHGLALLGAPGGHVQVTSYGDGAARCQALTWDEENVWVRCFDMAGQLADSRFTVAHYKDERHADEIAWTRADQPWLPIYTPSSTYTRNPSGGATSISRLATGVFEVKFNGFENPSGGAIHASVTPYGAASTSCNVYQLITDGARVRCVNANGASVDAVFGLMMIQLDQAVRDVAYVHVADATTPGTRYEPDHSSPGGGVTRDRQAIGSYVVEFADYIPVQLPGADWGTVQVAARGASDVWCNVELWVRSWVSVQCFDSAGAPADAEFDVLYHHQSRTPFNQEYAFGHAGNPTSPQYVMGSSTSYSAAHRELIFKRTGTGMYRVEWPGMENVGSDLGVVIVSSPDPGAHCWATNNWHGFADIMCTNLFNGLNRDARYDVLLWRPTEGTYGVAYAYDDNPTAATFTPHDSSTHNPSGGPTTIHRLGVGHWEIVWEGYGATADIEIGHPIVREYAGNHRCNTGAIHPDGDRMQVRCFDIFGNPVDAPFVALYLKAHRDLHGIAYSWADLSTANSYDALPSYGYSGDEWFAPRHWKGSGAGDYGFGFDDFYAYGNPGNYGQTHATVHEASALHCRALDYPDSKVNGNVDGDVACTDYDNVAQNARYDVLHVRPHLAPEPSASSLFAAGLALVVALRRRRTGLARANARVR